ncbi:YibE/F family protein [Erysipelothrix rhusiopathiae]|uniref:YibE/F family protein n=1 Tax=Erysipelothrix rhusiopathiae TaxID=1648 RepID=UPI0029540487|nr:YibE/F family protein [Erysipelothrix rhusiopathiae]MDV7679568.1 YibE/F family protein [Erysipelothrix rhusiopathiae]
MRKYLPQGVIILIIILCSILSYTFQNHAVIAQSLDLKHDALYQGTVTKVRTEKDEVSKMTKLFLEVYSESFPYLNKTVSIEQSLSENTAQALLPLHKGDSVLLNQTTNDEGVQYTLNGPSRSMRIFVVIGVFSILLLLIARRQGLKTLISFASTVFVVGTIFIPGILAQQNMYLLILIVSLCITLLSFITLSGFSNKTMASIVGTLGGVLVAIISAMLIVFFLKIRGAASEEYSYIAMMNREQPFNVNQILFGAVIIGGLGAMMDISMSIASSMCEMIEIEASLSRHDLVKAGMNVGIDAISTMVTTLVLAYTGGALPSIILLNLYQRSGTYILNSLWFSVEVLQALVGSIGMMAAVPLTVYFMSWIQKRSRQKAITKT